MAENNGIPEITFTVTPSDTIEAPVDTSLSIQGQAADAYATGQAISALRTSLEALNNTLFPVGTVYTTTLAAIPFNFGTWVEIQTPATWGDLEDGNRSYVDGTGTGTLHSFRRTA